MTSGAGIPRILRAIAGVAASITFLPAPDNNRGWSLRLRRHESRIFQTRLPQQVDHRPQCPFFLVRRNSRAVEGAQPTILSELAMVFAPFSGRGPANLFFLPPIRRPRRWCVIWHATSHRGVKIGLPESRNGPPSGHPRSSKWPVLRRMPRPLLCSITPVHRRNNGKSSLPAGKPGRDSYFPPHPPKPESWGSGLSGATFVSRLLQAFCRATAFVGSRCKARFRSSGLRPSTAWRLLSNFRVARAPGLFEDQFAVALGPVSSTRRQIFSNIFLRRPPRLSELCPNRPQSTERFLFLAFSCLLQ